MREAPNLALLTALPTGPSHSPRPDVRRTLGAPVSGLTRNVPPLTVSGSSSNTRSAVARSPSRSVRSSTTPLRPLASNAELTMLPISAAAMLRLLADVGSRRSSCDAVPSSSCVSFFAATASLCALATWPAGVLSTSFLIRSEESSRPLVAVSRMSLPRCTASLDAPALPIAPEPPTYEIGSVTTSPTNALPIFAALVSRLSSGLTLKPGTSPVPISNSPVNASRADSRGLRTLSSGRSTPRRSNRPARMARPPDEITPV